jgi:hypothetical protein
MEERELKEKIDEGHLHVRAIIEVIGKPIEHVQKTIKEYVQGIKKGFTVIKIHVEDAEEQENFFSTFAEVELLLKNVQELLKFSFEFMPSSVEIIEPERINIENNEFTNYLNDLQARVHGLNTGLIQARDQSLLYVKNTAVLLRNFIVVVLARHPMTVDEIQPLMGVQADDIKKVLGVLIKEGKVKLIETKYTLIKQKND